MCLMRGRGRISDLLAEGNATASRFGREARDDYLADAAAPLAQRGDAESAIRAVADVLAIMQEFGHRQSSTRVTSR
jgi:hypothetical protein